MILSLQVRTVITRMMTISLSSSVLLLLLITLPVQCAPAVAKQYLSDFDEGFRLHGNLADLQKNGDLLKELRSFLSSAQKHRGVARTDKNFPTLFENQSAVEQNRLDFDTLDTPQISQLTRSTTGAKRQLKFNPTGWRKKRSTDEYSELENLLNENDQSDEDDVKLLPISSKLRLLLKPVIIRRSNNNADGSMDRLDDILAHLRSFLAKRKSGKPLDFNPTGW